MNINDFIYVKLTPFGLEFLNRVAPNHAKFNTEGEWTKFSLWKWASIFGSHLGKNGEQLFWKNEIRLDSGIHLQFWTSLRSGERQ